MGHEAPFTIALALAVGMAVQCAARSLRVPGVVLLLAAGVGLGPAGLGWVQPEVLGDALFVVVDFAVAIILFEGALNLRLRRLQREERAIRNLVTWAALVTLTGGALAARVWLDWSWPLALLFGALVVVTGPTVVSPLVRDLRLHPRLQTILEAEGVLIDPVGGAAGGAGAADHAGGRRRRRRERVRRPLRSNRSRRRVRGARRADDCRAPAPALGGSRL
jgi:NhaP-type Na+/H+ or K+/H+ antiporter